jgi:hypothetical protein
MQEAYCRYLGDHYGNESTVNSTPQSPAKSRRLSRIARHFSGPIRRAVCHDIPDISVRVLDTLVRFRRLCSLPADRASHENRDMSTTTRKQRSYDHRLRELVQSTRDVNLAIQRGVPRSTAHGWLTATPTEATWWVAID